MPLDLMALPEDPGQTVTACPPAKPHVSPADKRVAVEKVLKLLGRATAGPHRPSPALPSARARSAIERLANYGTVEAYSASEPNLKELARDLFDWHNADSSVRATKPMARAIGSILTARSDTGVSLYPQAVEMLSFAAAASPLLQPDRLQRVIEMAPTVPTAFAPERYTMQLASALQTILGRYSEAKREELLISLWAEAHDGRWWDLTSGLVTIVTGHRRRKLEGEEAERRTANDTLIREITAGAGIGTQEASTAIRQALIDGALPYHQATQALVAAIPADPELRANMISLAQKLSSGETVDPDIAVHASALPWLLPGERPETPITWLLRTLCAGLTPDAATGVVQVEDMPEKPKSFRALFPEASLEEFAISAHVRHLDRTLLPGTGDVVIEVVHNAVELEANRTYMGNCTYSYLAQLRQGRNLLFKLWRGSDCYNAMAYQSSVGWNVTQVNSRFNRGGVPADIANAFRALTASLPTAAQTPAEDPSRRQRITARTRYRLA